MATLPARSSTISPRSTACPCRPTLKVVELPDDTVPAAWAPEIAAISSRVVGGKLNYRLLANMIAHQWWGVAVSPATRNDWWITDGMARYAEAQYVEHVCRQRRRGRSDQGYVCRRAGLRHGAAWPTGNPGAVRSGLSVAGHGQGRHGLPHASLGDRRAELRQACAQPGAAVPGQAGQRGRSRKTGRPGLRRKADVVFYPVAGFDRRSGVQEQVHHLPHQQRLPRGGRDPAGPRPVPHAGRAEDRHRRQDGDQEGRSGRNQFRL